MNTVSISATTVMALVILCRQQAESEEQTSRLHSSPGIKDYHLNRARDWRALADELEKATK